MKISNQTIYALALGPSHTTSSYLLEIRKLKKKRKKEISFAQGYS